jgi:hypothetical protein
MISAEAQASPKSASPNPQKAPAYDLDPAGLLVYLDPWFAGTITFWLYFWSVLLTLFVLVIVLMPVQRKADSGSASARRFVMIGIVSVVIGCAFAGPWIYALLRHTPMGDPHRAERAAAADGATIVVSRSSLSLSAATAAELWRWATQEFVQHEGLQAEKDFFLPPGRGVVISSASLSNQWLGSGGGWWKVSTGTG